MPMPQVNLGQLVKLGSIVRHVEEHEQTGLDIDLHSARVLCDDPEIKKIMRELDNQSLLPVMRERE